MYRATSYLSLIFGCLATLSVFKTGFIFIGLVCCLLGFTASIVNIFIQTKYMMERRLLTRAYLGMVLSSVPVIYIMVVLLLFKN